MLKIVFSIFAVCSSEKFFYLCVIFLRVKFSQLVFEIFLTAKLSRFTVYIMAETGALVCQSPVYGDSYVLYCFSILSIVIPSWSNSSTFDQLTPAFISFHFYCTVFLFWITDPRSERGLSVKYLALASGSAQCLLYNALYNCFRSSSDWIWRASCRGW